MSAFIVKLIRSQKHLMGTFGVLFSLLITTLFLVDLKARYNGAIETAKTATLEDAEILADHAAATFETVDRILRETELIRENALSGNRATSEATNAALRHLAQTSPLVLAIAWTNAAGDL